MVSSVVVALPPVLNNTSIFCLLSVCVCLLLWVLVSSWFIFCSGDGGFPTFSISNAAIKLWLQLAASLFCRWFSVAHVLPSVGLCWSFPLRDDLLACHRSLAGFLCWEMDSWLCSVQTYWCSQTFSSGCVFSLFFVFYANRTSEENKSVLIICRFLCISILTLQTVNYYQTAFIHKSLKAFIHRCILFWHVVNITFWWLQV